MDLSLSTDFDSTLLNWDEDETQQHESDGIASGSTSGSHSLDGNGENGAKHAFGTQAMKEGFSRLPSFPTAIGGFSSTSDQPQDSNHTTSEQAAATAAANLQNVYATQMLYPLTGTGQNSSTAAQANGSTNLMQQNLMVQYALTGQSAGAPFPNVSFSNKSQMDTVSSLSATTGGNLSSTNGNLSSAAAPHPAVAAAPGSRTQPSAQVNGALPTTQLHPLGIQSSAGCPPLSASSAPAPAPNAAAQYMFNPYSMLAASNPQLFAAFQSSAQQQMMAQYAAAQATAAQATAAQASAAHAAAQAAAPTPPQPKAKKQKSSASKKKRASEKKDDEPPFLLFDAPCELRQNFMQTQRTLNLPVHQDGNSYHYGMAVNGFHPQLNVLTDPIRPLSSTEPVLPPGVNIKLLDSRHKKRKGAGKERNEREQKRAQKITELIEQIRTSMEDGGWKVEMKSKYHTLSM